MKILFVTATRIGDAVLSTGLLAYLIGRYPGAAITIAAGPLAAPLFEAVPGLKRIIVVDKKKFARHWAKLYLAVAAARWDLVVDLRGSALAYLLWAGERRTAGPMIGPVRGWIDPCPALADKTSQTARRMGGIESDFGQPRRWSDAHVVLDESNRVQARRLRQVDGVTIDRFFPHDHDAPLATSPPGGSTPIVALETGRRGPRPSRRKFRDR